MKRKISILMYMICGLLAWTLSAQTDGKPLAIEPETPYVEGRLILKLAPGAGQAAVNHRRAGERDGEVPTLRALSTAYRAQIKGLRPHRAIGDYYIADTVEGTDIAALCRRLEKDPRVAAASPDYYAVICDTIPDDPHIQYQYSLYNTGQVFLTQTGLSGTAGCDIKAVQAWDWATGSSDIIIAILDTGIADDHEDLQGKVVQGYNYVDDSADTYDDQGHGTFVASIAAANTNNGVGIAGVSWNSMVMPVKVMDSKGLGSYGNIANGIRFAVDHGARIINLSIGGRSPSFILEDACKYAYTNGAIIVAATGNTGSPVLYPAAYDDYCLAVAATDANDLRPNWSNYGPQVDVAAPGSFVQGAMFFPIDPENLNTYGWGNGTSYSTPYAAGAAALLLSHKPGLSNQEVMDLIKYTADDVNQATNPGVDSFLGYGRINLATLLGPYVLE